MLSPRGKKELKINQRRILINSIEIGIPAPEQVFILGQRHTSNGKIVGRVRNSKTLNYKSFTPHRDGLFCERIFGPVQSYICACGKQGPLTTSKGTLKFCPRCEVEYTDQRARRYRVGYIELVSPVTHIWNLKGRPSYLSLFLGKRKKTLATLAYCNDYLVEQAFSKVSGNSALTSAKHHRGELLPSKIPVTDCALTSGLPGVALARSESDRTFGRFRLHSLTHRVSEEGATTSGATFFKNRILKGLKESLSLKGLTIKQRTSAKRKFAVQSKTIKGLTISREQEKSKVWSPEANFIDRPLTKSACLSEPSSDKQALTGASFQRRKVEPFNKQNRKCTSFLKSLRQRAALQNRAKTAPKRSLRDSLAGWSSPKKSNRILPSSSAPRKREVSELPFGVVGTTFRQQRGTLSYTRSHTLPFLPTFICEFHLRDGLLSFFDTFPPSEDIPIPAYCKIPRRYPLRDVHKFMADQAFSKVQFLAPSVTRAEPAKLSAYRPSLESDDTAEFGNRHVAAERSSATANSSIKGFNSQNRLVGDQGQLRRSPSPQAELLLNRALSLRSLSLTFGRTPKVSESERSESAQSFPPRPRPLQGRGRESKAKLCKLRPKVCESASDGLEPEVRDVLTFLLSEAEHEQARIWPVGRKLEFANRTGALVRGASQHSSVTVLREVLLSLLLSRVVTTLIGFTPSLPTCLNRPESTITESKVLVGGKPTVVMARRVGSQITVAERGSNNFRATSHLTKVRRTRTSRTLPKLEVELRLALRRRGATRLLPKRVPTRYLATQSKKVSSKISEATVRPPEKKNDLNQPDFRRTGRLAHFRTLSVYGRKCAKVQVTTRSLTLLRNERYLSLTFDRTPKVSERYGVSTKSKSSYSKSKIGSKNFQLKGSNGYRLPIIGESPARLPIRLVFADVWSNMGSLSQAWLANPYGSSRGEFNRAVTFDHFSEAKVRRQVGRKSGGLRLNSQLAPDAGTSGQDRNADLFDNRKDVLALPIEADNLGEKLGEPGNPRLEKSSNQEDFEVAKRPRASLEDSFFSLRSWVRQRRTFNPLWGQPAAERSSATARLLIGTPKVIERDGAARSGKLSPYWPTRESDGLLGFSESLEDWLESWFDRWLQKRSGVKGVLSAAGQIDLLGNWKYVLATGAVQTFGERELSLELPSGSLALSLGSLSHTFGVRPKVSESARERTLKLHLGTIKGPLLLLALRSYALGLIGRSGDTTSFLSQYQLTKSVEGSSCLDPESPNIGSTSLEIQLLLPEHDSDQKTFSLERFTSKLAANEARSKVSKGHTLQHKLTKSNEDKIRSVGPKHNIACYLVKHDQRVNWIKREAVSFTREPDTEMNCPDLSTQSAGSEIDLLPMIPVTLLNSFVVDRGRGYYLRKFGESTFQLACSALGDTQKISYTSEGPKTRTSRTLASLELELPFLDASSPSKNCAHFRSLSAGRPKFSLQSEALQRTAPILALSLREGGRSESASERSKSLAVAELRSAVGYPSPPPFSPFSPFSPFGGGGGVRPSSDTNSVRSFAKRELALQATKKQATKNNNERTSFLNLDSHVWLPKIVTIFKIIGPKKELIVASQLNAGTQFRLGVLSQRLTKKGPKESQKQSPNNKKLIFTGSANTREYTIGRTMPSESGNQTSQSIEKATSKGDLNLNSHETKGSTFSECLSGNFMPTGKTFAFSCLPSCSAKLSTSKKVSTRKLLAKIRRTFTFGLPTKLSQSESYTSLTNPRFVVTGSSWARRALERYRDTDLGASLTRVQQLTKSAPANRDVFFDNEGTIATTFQPSSFAQALLELPNQTQDGKMKPDLFVSNEDEYGDEEGPVLPPFGRLDKEQLERGANSHSTKARVREAQVTVTPAKFELTGKVNTDSYMKAQLDLQAIQEVLSYTGGGALRELLRCFDTQAFSVILLNEIKLLREYHKGYFLYEYAQLSRKAGTRAQLELDPLVHSEAEHANSNSRYANSSFTRVRVAPLKTDRELGKTADLRKAEVALQKGVRSSKTKEIEIGKNPPFGSNLNFRRTRAVTDPSFPPFSPFSPFGGGDGGGVKVAGRLAKVSEAKVADYNNNYEELPEEINRFSRAIHRNARRLKIVQLLMRNKRRPEWMLISALPVLPPDLRPILQMSEKLIVASDLNTLYQRVIYRNNRQYKLRIVEWSYATSLQRLVQDAVDRLIENGKGGSKPFLTPGGRPLKSLSDTLKGKKGRFRLNLLGKRVDFSGRSVIVVSPHLRIHECGLPREMALELYQYLLIRQMLLKRQVSSVILAKRVIRQQKAFVWDTLRELIYHHPLLLNRAPTLHRLGIQAFQPKLVLGSTILLHPLVCAGFNADFDGDQMGVHIPLCDEARAEAWDLLWSRNNLLSPATGEPILLPSQDMVLGFYHMTALLPSRYTNLTTQTASSTHFQKAQVRAILRSADKTGQTFDEPPVGGLPSRSKALQRTVPLLALSHTFGRRPKVSESERSESVQSEALQAAGYPPKGGVRRPIGRKLHRSYGFVPIADCSVELSTPTKVRTPLLLLPLAPRSRAKGKEEKGFRKSYFFSTLDVVRAYQNGGLDIHTPIWLQWKGKIENNDSDQTPLELRINSFGVSTQLYPSYKYRKDASYKSIATFNLFIRTTPGRVVVNNMFLNCSD